MRKHLAVSLAVTAALVGLPWSGGVQRTSLANTRTATASAALSVSAASRAMDAGGIVKTGPLVTQLVTPTKVIAVPGYADIYLAGRSFPFQIPGKSGVDYAGRQNPSQVQIQVQAGSV